MFHRPSNPNSPTTPAQGESQTMNQASQTPESAEAAERSVDIPASPFQRPGVAAAPAAAAAARPAQSYGTYSGAYGVPQASAAASADPKARRLVIGSGITMSGEIESCDILIVEGTVEAALKGASTLEIAESGMFYGTVEIDEAVIAGKFEGDLTVNGRLTVRSTGSITGAIAYKELAVEAGANIDGKILPLVGKGAASEKKSHKGKSDFPVKVETSRANTNNAQDELPILQRAAS